MNTEGVLNVFQAWYALLNWYAGVVDHSAMVLQKNPVSRTWNSDVPLKNKFPYKMFKHIEMCHVRGISIFVLGLQLYHLQGADIAVLQLETSCGWTSEIFFYKILILFSITFIYWYKISYFHWLFTDFWLLDAMEIWVHAWWMDWLCYCLINIKSTFITPLGFPKVLLRTFFPFEKYTRGEQLKRIQA